MLNSYVFYILFCDEMLLGFQKTIVEYFETFVQKLLSDAFLFCGDLKMLNLI